MPPSHLRVLTDRTNSLVRMICRYVDTGGGGGRAPKHFQDRLNFFRPLPRTSIDYMYVPPPQKKKTTTTTNKQTNKLTNKHQTLATSLMICPLNDQIRVVYDLLAIITNYNDVFTAKCREFSWLTTGNLWAFYELVKDR